MKWVLIMLCFSLNLIASEVDKFENYFDSDVEFQLLEDYQNMISSSHPEKFYRLEDDKFLEFVGVYELEAYDEIYDNFINLFQSERNKGNNLVWFEGDNEKGVIKVDKGLIWIKYLKRKD